MSDYTFLWGKKEVSVSFLADWNVETLLPPLNKQQAANEKQLVTRALEKPYGPRLEQIARPGLGVVVVISDHSRAWQQPKIFLPLIIERLYRAGISDAEITVLVATGMHNPPDKTQLQELLGDCLPVGVRVVIHDCHDEENLTLMGESAPDRPVWINRLVAEAGTVVLTGAVGFHNLAGFSGGIKALVPGVAGYETIQANHRLCLDAKGNRHPLVKAGITRGNPLFEDLQRAAELVKIDFMLNIVVNGDGRYTGAAAGECESAHHAACDIARTCFAVKRPLVADLVIANLGGYPRDKELYQAMKVLDHVTGVCRPGGTIILSCFCDNGPGPQDWLSWFERNSPQTVSAALMEEFSFSGYVALKLMKASQQYRLILASSLAPELVRYLGMDPAGSIEEALALAGGHRGIHAVFIPQAATTIPVAD